MYYFFTRETRGWTRAIRWFIFVMFSFFVYENTSIPCTSTGRFPFFHHFTFNRLFRGGLTTPGTNTFDHESSISSSGATGAPFDDGCRPTQPGHARQPPCSRAAAGGSENGVGPQGDWWGSLFTQYPTS